MATSSVTDSSASAIAALNAASSSAGVKKDDGSERFLRLLVTQMQNQDPLNPMDNAQVTSQIAQINTVTGIEKLNTTVQSLSSQMLQSQALQGASLVGRSVLLQGNALHFDATRTATAGFELASAADDVKIEVLSPSGRVLDTIVVGAADAGRSGFEWKAPEGASTDGITFRVVARSGAAALGATPLTTDLVRSVSTGTEGGLNLSLLHGGDVPYTQIKAFS
ncbi:MAG TPA: flagellar hook assembly protein FlgD [Methylibium sp.]|uniref:flagellar hook assembly protein FlgD n=1 Tax=Methylibium sp. TaxID=2067992 RepID=UPI002DB5BC00|nr:flagellar hook assembly protein FlgD [Methylibium sp.]HEU4457982.1 flagellar hook assembly protein FlgD [Methylibium sp.]